RRARPLDPRGAGDRPGRHRDPRAAGRPGGAAAAGADGPPGGRRGGLRDRATAPLRRGGRAGARRHRAARPPERERTDPDQRDPRAVASRGPPGADAARLHRLERLSGGASMRISSLPSLPAPPTWLRVLMQIAYPFVGAVLSLVFIGLAAVTLLLWPIDRRLALPRCLLLTMWFVWGDIGIVARCWWLRVRSPFGRSRTWEQDHLDAIVETLKSVMHAARVLVGFRIETEGELQLGRPGRPLVVISRHAGPADSLALGWLLARAGRIPRIVLADAMLWDPGVATVPHRPDSYFQPS